MPQFRFTCPEQKRAAGRIEAIQVRGPFMRPVQLPTGQTGYQPDSTMAWNWLIGNLDKFNPPLPFPPNTPFTPALEDPQYVPQIDVTPRVVGVHLTPVPTVQRTVIDAPTMQPTGNPGASPPGGGMENWLPNQRMDTGYEIISDQALPRSADPMLGEIDPEGGTFTDISSTGVEIKRELRRPYGPNLQGGQR